MPYQRKTKDEYRFWINYGQGFKHETSEDTRRTARDQQACYRENTNYRYATKITGPHRVPK